MIPISGRQTWQCGRYTVQQVVRPDNPAFPRYLIFRNEKLVGVSFSMLDASWCESVERITKLGRYVEELSKPKSYGFSLPAHNSASAKRGRRAKIANNIIARKAA